MTLQERYDHLLQLAGHLRKLQKLKDGRGYLTIDEKKTYISINSKMDRIIDTAVQKATQQSIFKQS